MVTTTTDDDDKSPQSLKSARSKIAVEAYGDEKQQAVEGLERFEKVHFRTTVTLQACSFLAFALMLTVEWISDIRAAETQWVIDLSVLGKDVIYYDEVLTSSARLYALTSDILWRDTYFGGIPPLDSALKDIKDQAPDIADEFDANTVVANGNLIDAETASMDAVTAGDSATAVDLVFNDEYLANKKQLLDGVATLDGEIENRRSSNEDTQSWWGVLSVTVVAVAFLAEIGSTIGLSKLDTKLQAVAEKADDAKDTYSHLVRDALLKAMQTATARMSQKGDAFDKTATDGSARKEADDERREANRAKIWRIRCYSALVDVLGVLAVGIPSVLTLIALVNASSTDTLQDIVLHMRMIQYYDLTLTSSAQLCAMTEDLQWADRYDTFVVPIETEIAELEKLEPDLVAEFVTTTTNANNALIDLETVALENCVSDPVKARSVLFGDEYAEQKAILLDGIADLRAKVDKKQLDHEESERRFDIISRILMIVCTLGVVGTDLVRVILAVWVESCVRSHHQVHFEGEDEFMCAVEKLLEKQAEMTSTLRNRSTYKDEPPAAPDVIVPLINVPGSS